MKFGALTCTMMLVVGPFFATHQAVAQVETGAISVSIEEVRNELANSGDRYRRILDSASLSAGVYSLDAGAQDRQSPHRRDEVYYVLSGRARLVAGMDTLEAIPGRALFVPAEQTHHFVEIKERLELLVFFGGGPD